ncbi:unnamed protein product [Meloidogyne enterolobii]|uniref:Uncharacterized protein n=1 Tax=Meloidogyne enterolobii TaxID=390850 RepID=A0ACB0YXM5_MELEN
MKTPKQLEEWSFSTTNSDNIKADLNKIGDETLVEEDSFTEKSLETSSIDGLSTICSSSFCSAQNINGGLKQRLKKLEVKKQFSVKLKYVDGYESTPEDLSQPPFVAPYFTFYRGFYIYILLSIGDYINLKSAISRDIGD